MIAFTSLVSPEHDHDLIPYWVAHYARYKFDRYKIFLHDTGTDHIFDALKIMESAGFETVLVSGDFDNGALQKYHLSAFKATLDPDDTLVVADSDEFQDMGDNYRDLIEQYEVIQGKLVDRWGNRAINALPVNHGILLQQQYPNEGCIAAGVCEKIQFNVAMTQFRMYQKVLAHRVRFNISLDGAHAVIDLPFTSKVLHEIKVFHYTWREGLIRRFADRSHMDTIWVMALARYFDLDENQLAPVFSRFYREKIVKFA